MKNSLFASLLGLLISLFAVGCSSNGATSDAHKQLIRAHDAMESERIALDSTFAAMLMAHDTLVRGERDRHPGTDSLQAAFEETHQAVFLAQAKVRAAHDALVQNHARMEFAHMTGTITADSIQSDHDRMEAEHKAMVADHAKLAAEQRRLIDEHLKRIADRAAAEAAAKLALIPVPIPTPVPLDAPPVVDQVQH
jgi:hypothetical protein